jgi:Dipeptidyl aminopeptidases/acylaminoacyl-peptidases
MNRIAKPVLLSVCLLVFAYQPFAQKKPLTQEQFFKNKFYGIINPLPSVISWNDDEHLILARKVHPDSVAKSFLFDPKTVKEMLMKEDSAGKRKVQQGKNVYSRNDDLYYKNGDQPEIRLTNDNDKEINPTFSPDSNYIAYTKKNNLYLIDLTAKKETQLTTDGNDSILNGYASWVYTEEILGRPSKYRSFWWSPDSKHIAFFRTDDSPVPIHTITDGQGQHGLEEKERYPKVGDKNPEIKIGIIHVDDRHITWSDFNEKDDQYFGMPYWTPDGNSLWVQWMNRLQNNLKIYAVNPNTGDKKEVYDETQKTWIQLEDGYERIHFLKDNKHFILESDKTGWNHLYLYDISGKLINPVTSGKFTVTGLTRIDEKNQMIYFTARSRENTARTDFYNIKFNGRDLKRLTFGDYNHSIQMSPSGNYFITTYSNTTTPPKMALLGNRGNLVKELGDSKGPEFNNYAIAKSELIRVKSEDGLFDLPVVVTWPENMDPNKKYPVLISIYGGPNAGSVMDRWELSGLQQWYAKEGLILLNMDHRASGHFGKEGVNYMYHNLGYWELKDYSTIVKYFISKGYADPARICITGFSYGGYMTCYALTHGADIFTHGMAGGSVTDWTFYDTHYTERYMGTPANNAEGYKTSSVLNYTDKYKGMLQIVHGVIDDNVHVQNSLRLISALEDGKKDFEFMLYPGGRHGWGGNKQLHYQNLKTKFIYKYLLQKDVPDGILK